MESKNQLIEYIGINYFKDIDDNYLDEFSTVYNLANNIDEIVKIQGSISLEHFEIINKDYAFCVFKLVSSIEYVCSKNNASLSLLEKSSYVSSNFKIKDINKNKPKVYIRNLKGKLITKNELLIYYNIVMVLE